MTETKLTRTCQSTGMRCALLTFFCMVFLVPVIVVAQQKPNIIFIIADDLGYGDLSCHGNPIMQTPNIDRLHAQSIRLTNYHTGTTCSPTRAALMTGRHYDNIGVWHTIINRSHLRPGIKTLPEMLSDNGYHTALFGKWHLGDNKPMRPQDRGFQYTLLHGGGGVGQTPDHWGNDYFDDVYLRNGVPEKFEGYCTDIWFSEATQYIERQSKTGQPFFCYIALNAPHQPHRAPQKNTEKYLNNPSVVDPVFYGMIANIDDNMNRLLARLDDLNLSQNTIFIFTSDNGTSNKAGVLVDENGFVKKGFNAGMRGVKAQPYEGGHRVPFFMRFPQMQLNGGKDIPQLASCMDVLPTLLDLCGISSRPSAVEGESLVPYLRSGKSDPAKIYIADTQRDRFLTRYKDYCVMRGDWRLVGKELYDLSVDPEQRRDISSRFPDTVVVLQEAYDKWWKGVARQNKRHPFVRIPIKPFETTTITCMDLFPDDDKYPAWNQDMASKEQNNKSGRWMLRVPVAGTYEVAVQQLPREVDDARQPRFTSPASAFVQANEKRLVNDRLDHKQTRFQIKLPKGDVDFRAGFTDAEGRAIAAQYLYFKRL